MVDETVTAKWVCNVCELNCEVVIPEGQESYYRCDYFPTLQAIYKKKIDGK